MLATRTAITSALRPALRAQGAAIARQPVRYASSAGGRRPSGKSTSGVVFGVGATAGLLAWAAVFSALGQKKTKPHGHAATHKSSSTDSTPTDLAATASAAASTLPGPSSSDAPISDGAGDDSPSPSESESEAPAGQQAAYDPVTGEINWACPCLGGMADGPCGEEFKAAFSCFVYSEVEPKGVECVDKFRGMQECFRKHPDIYGSDDESEDDDLVDRAEAWLAVPDEEFIPKDVSEAAQLE